MASSKIFIGEIMGDMVTSLDSMSVKTAQMVEELQNVNNTVGQSVDVGSVRAGNMVEIVLNESDIVTSESTAYVEIARGRFYCKGSVRLTGTIKHSSTAATATLQYSLDGGATKTQIGSGQGNAYGEKTVNIFVEAGMEIIFYTKGVLGTSVTTQARSLKVCYDLLNLVNEGFFVKI